jgi:hypothetical protein
LLQKSQVGERAYSVIPRHVLDTSSDTGVNHATLNRMSNVGDRLQRRGALAVDSLEARFDGETTIRSGQRAFRGGKDYSGSSPSVEGSETSTLGSTELHEDGTSVDVLNSATVHVDSEALEALLGRAKDVREQLLGIHVLETTLELADGGTKTGYELQRQVRQLTPASTTIIRGWRETDHHIRGVLLDNASERTASRSRKHGGRGERLRRRGCGGKERVESADRGSTGDGRLRLERERKGLCNLQQSRSVGRVALKVSQSAHTAAPLVSPSAEALSQDSGGKSP